MFTLFAALLCGATAIWSQESGYKQLDAMVPVWKKAQQTTFGYPASQESLLANFYQWYIDSGMDIVNLNNALRELMMNACMHRDYQSNMPIRLYQFDDHIEIMNAGGLYGEARPENFPNVNDYRNPIIAEAMKEMKYVNMFNQGIRRVQDMLLENGNKEAVFDVSKLTAFEVTVPSTVDVTQDVPQGVPQGVPQDVPQDVPQGGTQDDTQDDPQGDTQGDTQGKTLDVWIEEQIRRNPKITTEELAILCGFTSKTIKRHIIKLSHIKYVGSGYSGHWEIVDNNTGA